jgi:tyrosine-protein phosphatase non-receptor type 23
LTFSSDVINGKLDISKKENEFVYHEKVPDFDSLPELRGASLVKGMGFEITDPEISGPDIFARLVPLEAHEASSLYRFYFISLLYSSQLEILYNLHFFSEEKAQILRLIGSEIEAKNESLELFLSALSLSEVPCPGKTIPTLLHMLIYVMNVSRNYEWSFLGDHLALPQELIEAAAGLSVHKEDVVKRLIDAMASIASVAGEVQVNISYIREILADEQTQEDEYTSIVGPRPSPRIDEFDKECSKYEEAHRVRRFELFQKSKLFLKFIVCN